MSARPDVRLLVADVDGTLLTGDKILTDAAKAVVREMHGAGILFAFTATRCAAVKKAPA